MVRSISVVAASTLFFASLHFFAVTNVGNPARNILQTHILILDGAKYVSLNSTSDSIVEVQQDLRRHGSSSLPSPIPSISFGIEQIIAACRLLPSHTNNDEVSPCISKAKLTDTYYRFRTEEVFREASMHINRMWSKWPGFDYSDSSKQPVRVLAFTLCTPGKPSSNNEGQEVRASSSHSEMQNLCDAQREGMELWGKQNYIAFRQVVETESVDQERAPHWQKVAYAHAFLQLDFDLVFFLDADCMVTNTRWDIRDFANSAMPIGSDKLWVFVDDTLDWHATGEFLIRRNKTSLSFLRDWYTFSVPFFNTTITDAFLRKQQPGLNSNPWEYMNKKDRELGVQRHAPTKRCDGFMVFHEQGCLGQFYAAAPRYLLHLSLLNADSLRRMFLGALPDNPLLHVCCRSRAEQASQLRECVGKMKAHGSC
jgi:hypothetical protein